MVKFNVLYPHRIYDIRYINEDALLTLGLWGKLSTQKKTTFTNRRLVTKNNLCWLKSPFAAH